MTVRELTRWLAARQISVHLSAEDGFEIETTDDVSDADLAVVFRHAGLLDVLITRPYACRRPGCPCRVNAAVAAARALAGSGHLVPQRAPGGR